MENICNVVVQNFILDGDLIGCEKFYKQLFQIY